jgi:REP element-mobilizing transposase RayT
MARPSFHLNQGQRGVALTALINCLLDNRIEVAAAALDDHHLHLLGQFPDHHPRTHLGWAKLAATKCLKADGSIPKFPTGIGIWAKRSKAQPIKDRSHLVNTVNYIVSHEQRGAEIYLHSKLLEVRERKALKPK